MTSVFVFVKISIFPSLFLILSTIISRQFACCSLRIFQKLLANMKRLIARCFINSFLRPLLKKEVFKKKFLRKTVQLKNRSSSYDAESTNKSNSYINLRNKYNHPNKITSSSAIIKIKYNECSDSTNRSIITSFQFDQN